MTRAGQSLLAEGEVLEKDRVGDADFVLGRGVGHLGHGVVWRHEDGARDVQREVLDTAEIEEQVSLQSDLIRDQRQVEAGRGEMLQWRNTINNPLMQRIPALKVRT